MAVWSGTWVARRLGVGVEPAGAREMVGLAVRDNNPRRAHLLVSDVLGKHVPASPGAVLASGVELGRRVRDLLGAADGNGAPRPADGADAVDGNGAPRVTAGADGAPRAADGAVVLGYAETATGLGHCVADGLGAAAYLHSTRRPVAGVPPLGGFEEEHSHATSHLLLPADPGCLAGDGPLVLVDDELSTGRTVRNTLRVLHARHPRRRYVIAALVDMREPQERARLDALAAELDARIDVVALVAGRVQLPEDILERGAALVRDVAAAQPPRPAAPPADGADRRPVTRVPLGWPAGLPDGGRHGFTAADRARLDAALPAMGERLTGAVRTALDGLPRPLGAAAPRRRVLVLGCEELMYAPLRLAEALEQRFGSDAEVRYSTTTRSPVLPVDDPGYAIRTRLAFPAHDAGPGGDGVPAGGDAPDGAGGARAADAARPSAATTREAAPAAQEDLRYAYNVAAGAHGEPFDAVVAVVDSTADTRALHAPGGLLDRLRDAAGTVLLAVVPSHIPGRAAAPAGAGAPEATGVPAGSGVPDASGAPAASGADVLPEPLRGPGFSSYAPGEVGWLLTDLSDVALEAPVEEREEAVQSGGAHYAESLPVEYQPSPAYQRLFHAALEASAARIAHAVGVVTELVLAERGGSRAADGAGGGLVLASLARAGVPAGVLMRRWAAFRHGADLPHYALSIVRGRGIDPVALRWLAARHDPSRVVFVDGWTGKGVITRELADALAAEPAGAGFDPSVAVLADPGRCVRTFGTREDFLIPSACLNSTVSGLVSRTVLRADLVGPNTFHGAKYYAELAGSDVSALFLDAVTEHFADVAERAEAAAKRLAAGDGDGRAPTWEGWAAVRRISERYGIGDVNLVKPGVGETTRVMLRRVPWRVLVRPDAGSDLDHVRLLAEQRGVPVEEVDGLPYSCVGLIHPRYTRGAVGADGQAAAGA